MGAGRKTHTITVGEKSFQSYSSVNSSVSARNLPESDLAGVIFGCKHDTFEECLNKQLFGLPAPHFSYVRNVRPGLPLFLFNYSDRKLHGIFEAASRGWMKINPNAWTEDGSNNTPFPAQVKIRIRMQCQPLLEDQFKLIIAQNYYEPRLFWFELDRAQTNELIALFSASPNTSSSSLSRNIKNWNNSFESFGDPYTKQEANRSKKSALATRKQWSALFQDHTAHDTRKEDEEFDGKAPEMHSNLDQINTEWESFNPSQYWGESDQASIAPSNRVDSTAPKKWSSLFNDNTTSDSRKKVIEFVEQDPDTNLHHDQLNVKQESFDPSHCWDVASSDNVDSNKLKKWSAFFKDNATDSRKEIVQFDGQALEMNIRFDQFHVECESFDASHYSDQSSQVPEAALDWVDSREYDEAVSWQPITKGLYPTEASTSFPHCNSYGTSSVVARQKNQYLIAAASGMNIPYSENSPKECSSLWILPGLDGEKKHEALKQENILELHGEEHAPFKSDNECSSFPAYDHLEDSELQPSNLHFPDAAMQSNMDSSIFSKFLTEVERLKSSHLKQDQQIALLERQLVESRREIQKLRDQFKRLESGIPMKLVEAEDSEGKEFHLVDESHPTLDALICIVGGFDGQSWLSNLDLYSSSNDQLKPIASMNPIRKYASATKLNGELYIVGGLMSLDRDLWLDTVESYNPKGDHWISHPSLNRKKGNLGLLSLNNSILAIGGGNSYEFFSEVDILDPEVGKWIPIQPMLHKRSALAVAEVNGILYVSGGCDENHYLNAVERLDPRERSWTKLESMSTKRACHSLVALNAKLYAVGGFDGAEMIPTIEIYEPRTDSWMMGESMNNPRGYFGTLKIRDAMYVISGLKNVRPVEVAETVESYKEHRGWEEVTNWRAIGKRSSFSAVLM